MPAKKATAKAPAKKRAPRRPQQQKFIRNLRNVHVSLRLQESDRKIDLAPRGQRGDMTPLKKGDTNDPIYVANHTLLFEVITTEEAKKIAEQQATNEQKGPHPALQNIRNERGEDYPEDAVRLADEPGNDTGVTVAPVDQQGHVFFDNRVGIRRAAVPGSENREVPHVPDSISPEEQADYLADIRGKVIRGEVENS